MKIVRNKTTYQVFYHFPDTEQVEITEKSGLVSKSSSFRALDIKPSTHEIVEGVSKRQDWEYGAMGYDTDWFIFNQESYDFQKDEERKWQIQQKCDKIFQKRLQMTYRDELVQFPDGEGHIQFRNDFDRSNLGDIAAGATALASMDKNTPMMYRDAENVTHILTAHEMVVIAVGILQKKQQVVSASWVHKDTLRSLNTLEEVLAYDINVGWPA